MSLSPVREQAYDAFIRTMFQKMNPDLALEQGYTASEKAPSRLDRNFSKELVYGGLRWFSKIHWILQNTSSRDLEKCSFEVRAALVLGTYQIYYMDRVPDRAAVNESVEYIRKKGQASACSFVNGILRQIARRAEYFAKPDKVKEPVRYLSLQFSHPAWLVERWLRRFNFDKVELMLSSNNQPPVTSIRVNASLNPLENAHDLQQSLLRDEKTHSERRPLRSSLRLKEFPRTDESSYFGQGYFTIQDESSQLIALLVEAQANHIVIDACCGPGGKTGHLAEILDASITIVGVDQSSEAIAKAEQTAKRLKHDRLSFLCEDFLQWKPTQTIDTILLDAPCSALGTLRRHPEAKWHKDEKVINQMSQLQRRMLKHGLTLLPVGGELIYSVCSFELEETEHHLKALTEEFHDHVEIISPISRLPDYFKKYVTRDNVLLVYSGNQDDMDGFGAFILRVKKAF